MINVSNSGSGPVEVYPEISGIFLCGTLFLFDINIENTLKGSQLAKIAQEEEQ